MLVLLMTADVQQWMWQGGFIAFVQLLMAHQMIQQLLSTGTVFVPLEDAIEIGLSHKAATGPFNL
jgi:hypothetical protein